MRKWMTTVKLLGFSAMLGATACGAVDMADQESAVEGVASVEQEATASILVVGSIRDSAGVAVPGVTFKLSGAAARTTTANSSGIYQFASVPTGQYTVTPSKTGATFSPTSATFTATASVERAFRCTAGCEGAGTVVASKELTIVNPSVVNDARASNQTNGPWSFRFLMEQMTPAGVDPSDFVFAWTQGFLASAGPVNGFESSERFIDFGLLSSWPKKSNGKLDLAKSPFRLLAIVNRSDLHPTGNGEGRFVFGIIKDGRAGSCTVNFEYRLPVKNPAGAAVTRNDWIQQFHALGTQSFGATFNSRLQAITDQFTRANTTTANPNGSSISQVRTNEFEFGSPWQLREFRLVKNSAGKGFLKLSPVEQTPDLTLIDDASLASYIQQNRLKVLHGLAIVPNNLIGGTSEMVGVEWEFPSFPAVDERARHMFAGQTCNGCHNLETTQQIDSFYHVSPTAVGGSDGTGILSPFVKNVEHRRRSRFMQNRLACNLSAGTCSPGSDQLQF